jgi:hypothetical protein
VGQWNLAYDLAVSVLAFGFGGDDFRPDVTARRPRRLRQRPPVDDRGAGIARELRFAACRFAVTRITDVYMRRPAARPAARTSAATCSASSASKRHARPTGCIAPAPEGARLATMADVLAEPLLALAVELT